MIYPTIDFTPMPDKKIRVDCYCITDSNSFRGSKIKGECIINNKHYFFEEKCKVDSKNLVFSIVLENVNKVNARFVYYAGLITNTIGAKSTFEWVRF